MAHTPTSSSSSSISHKQAIATLLAELRRVTNLWFQDSKDRLPMLVSICCQILQHGLHKPDIEEQLIHDFEFLLASEQKLQLEAVEGPQPHHLQEFFPQWVRRGLQTRSLCQCLQSLVADKELLDGYYPRDGGAFLQQSAPTMTLFVCLTAVQMNQSSLLGQLEQRHHRRSCSQPNCSISPRLKVVWEEEPVHQQVKPLSLLRRPKSLPNLAHEEDQEELKRRRCQTFSPGSYQSSSGASHSSTSSQSSTNSPRRRIQVINCDDIKIWTDQSQTPPQNIAPRERKEPGGKRSSPLNNFLTNLFGSSPVYTSWFQPGLTEDTTHLGVGESVLDTFLPVNGRKLLKKPSLFEGVSMLDEAGAAAVPPPPLPSAPKDILGRGGAEGRAAGSLESSSSSNYSLNTVSDKMEQQSLATFLQMSRYTHNNTELEKENAHFRISEACIQAIEHLKWRNKESTPTPSSSSTCCCSSPHRLALPHSAEAVGLQLISRFNDQQLPKVGHLKWLVSEQDTPQQLLPMPKPMTSSGGSLTRGTKTWAPPRQQIIFTEHPSTSRSIQLQRQGQRCAGCGMHVARQYQHHFRYCTYLGKYLCTGCHRNQISAIPSKILQSWDFRCYPVSTFAYRLIEQMYTFPLFHVPDLNAQLYAKHKELNTARRRRMQLRAVKRFIQSCRFAVREQSLFDAIPAHITQDPDMWSMCDFVDVQNSSMTRSIEELIELGEQHVYNCVLCTGRAFVCELCKAPQLIYPWQRKIQRCLQCGACAHQRCWKAQRHEPCPRCARLQARARAS